MIFLRPTFTPLLGGRDVRPEIGEKAEPVLVDQPRILSGRALTIRVVPKFLLRSELSAALRHLQLGPVLPCSQIEVVASPR